MLQLKLFLPNGTLAKKPLITPPGPEVIHELPRLDSVSH